MYFHIKSDQLGCLSYNLVIPSLISCFICSSLMGDITFVIYDKPSVIFGDVIRYLCGGYDDTYICNVIMDISALVIFFSPKSCSCSSHDSNIYYWCMMNHICKVIVICVVTLGMSMIFSMFGIYLEVVLSVENEDC
jgi:hypothetical protein